MKIQRSVFSLVAVAALGVSALSLSSAAQARDVAWSVGVASPGVQIGVSNAPSVFYRQPVYVPQTVYYNPPQVVYVQPQVIYAPQPYYAAQPYYVNSGFATPVYYGGWGARHRGHNQRGDRERGDHREGRR